MYAKKFRHYLDNIQTEFRHYLDEFRYRLSKKFGQNLDKIQTTLEKFRQIQYVLNSSKLEVPGSLMGFSQALRLDTTSVLCTNHYPNSSSEQMPCSREEGEMRTQVIQNPLLARTTDTSLSLKDTSDIQRESSSSLRKTLNGQKSDPGLDTEGVHSMDTFKMDEPIELRIRRKFN